MENIQKCMSWGEEGVQGTPGRVIVIGWLELWGKHKVFCSEKGIHISGPSTQTGQLLGFWTFALLVFDHWQNQVAPTDNPC